LEPIQSFDKFNGTSLNKTSASFHKSDCSMVVYCSMVVCMTFLNICEVKWCQV